jgi:hypothetical protein
MMVSRSTTPARFSGFSGDSAMTSTPRPPALPDRLAGGGGSGDQEQDDDNLDLPQRPERSCYDGDDGNQSRAAELIEADGRLERKERRKYGNQDKRQHGQSERLGEISRRLASLNHSAQPREPRNPDGDLRRGDGMRQRRGEDQEERKRQAVEKRTSWRRRRFGFRVGCGHASGVYAGGADGVNRAHSAAQQALTKIRSRL